MHDSIFSNCNLLEAKNVRYNSQEDTGISTVQRNGTVSAPTAKDLSTAPL